jgi:hypothetical protein
MEEYRAYTLGGDGHILKANGFDCADDGAAIAHAAQFADGCDVELWCADRFVAKLAPNTKDESPAAFPSP